MATALIFNRRNHLVLYLPNWHLERVRQRGDDVYQNQSHDQFVKKLSIVKSFEGFVAVVQRTPSEAVIPEAKCLTYDEKEKALNKKYFNRYPSEGAPTLDLVTFPSSSFVAGGNADIPGSNKTMRWSMLLICK